MNQITMTPLTEILQTVGYSVDFHEVEAFPGDTMDDKRTAFWEKVIAVKSMDSGFGDLVDSIMERGFVDGSAIGWYPDYMEEGKPAITEGHHRLVAAILLGLDEVPTAIYGKSWVNPETGEFISAHHKDYDEEKVPYLV